MAARPWTRGDRLTALAIITVVMAWPWMVIAFLALRVDPWSGSLYVPTLLGTSRLYTVAQAAARFVLTGTPTRLR